MDKNRQACTTAEKLHLAHDFGQGKKRKAEQRTLFVTILTLVTMVAEIFGGWVTGSMALLADGIHMGGHALALGLATAAYYFSRRHAKDRRLSLGSGKIADLAAYTSALFLGASVVWLVFESIHRLLNPQALMAKEALLVAVIGLVINLLSAWLLAGSEDACQGHGHSHEPSQDHGHSHNHEHQQDNNLKAALVHVIADAVTSVAAILGLVAAWLWGWLWLDPAIALVASVVVLRWAVGLLRQTGGILLDAEAPNKLREDVLSKLNAIEGTQVLDLHLWSVGQGAWTLTASLVSHLDNSPNTYKQQLGDLPGLHHPIIEVHFCQACEAAV
ncbi:CDF family Co(II)/Ni(II) efflux transporter DmeF [Marinospirillum insulare]|uniref:Cation efflux system protein n=1 Tax=Marinospirillum insulare TaxID=217169 RepID=A0ABQ5ZW68_9GAMM|nr:CDF family Co(II)/Ni(II) efflux transporter DmeF [Marinospirillum insulare]GLR64249.1 cation efflux system protein [Marinospirillum insulare]